MSNQQDTTEINSSSPAQQAYWAELCHNVRNKNITMNDAYKKASEGFQNGNGGKIEGFVGSFKMWVNNALNNKWIENTMDIGEGVKEQADNEIRQANPVDAQPENPNRMRNIVIGVTLTVIIIGIGFYIYKKRQQNT